MRSTRVWQRVLQESNARHEVNSIMEYMTGIHPDQVKDGEEHHEGPAKCFGLLYSGEHAIERIRERERETPIPTKQQSGAYVVITVRTMRNGAHARMLWIVLWRSSLL